MTERSVSAATSEPSRPASTADGLADSRPSSASEKPTLLARYLLDLAMRPSQDPLLDLPEDFDLTTPAHARAGFGLTGGVNPSGGYTGGSSSQAFNPESDSFIYIEHLLEALAVLGRLGWALDALAQRETGEIFSLVDSTLEEVEERTVDRRQQATTNLVPTSALFLPPPPSSADDEVEYDETQPTATGGKLDEDAETLRDLFWTLYSKLDAVLQGFRVTSEVASRIGSVRPPGAPGRSIDWRLIRANCTSRSSAKSSRTTRTRCFETGPVWTQPTSGGRSRQRSRVSCEST